MFVYPVYYSLNWLLAWTIIGSDNQHFPDYQFILIFFFFYVIHD